MIATRTPFRITLGGGGTDLPDFYTRHGGYVLALGIDKYMYVVVNVPRADRLVRLHYTSSETVAHARELRHELAREALLLHGVPDAIEIASVADLPAGAGLGSSSSYLVGLLTALRAYRQTPVERQALAEEACHIELERLGKPIGKQDQYMAVYGGLTELVIDRTGQVAARRVVLAPHALDELVSRTHLYFTGTLRQSADLLAGQAEQLRQGPGAAVESGLLAIRDLGHAIGEAIQTGDFDRFGLLMHEHWDAKRRLSERVTLPVMESLYEHVRQEYGVLGGKVAGAGGGGFLMLYCPKDGERLTRFLESEGLPRLHYRAEPDGSRVLTHTLAADHRHLAVPEHATGDS